MSGIQLSLLDRGPGWKEPTTSRDAAKAIAPRATVLRGRCLEAFRSRGPMTADECAAVLGESVLAIRPRCSELRSEGLIEPTGERRANASGMRAAVWRARA